MLAHLKVWNIVSEMSEPCNIFEDDEIINNDYLDLRSSALNELVEKNISYDFINLNPLRPAGDGYSKNFYKISKSQSNGKNGIFYNVWASNYIITPKFAKILIDLYTNHPKFKDTFNTLIFDKLLSVVLHINSDKFNFFVMNKSNKISTHDEKFSLRQKINRT